VKLGTDRVYQERMAFMSLFGKHTRDLAHLKLVGLSLFRLKARENSRVPEQLCSWHEGNDGTVIGYEASWAGIFPHPAKWGLPDSN
jgi:hypothetical protein